MRLAVAFALLLALTVSVRAQPGPAVVLAWDPPRDNAGQVPPGLTGYQLQRCTVPAGQSSCTPQDLPQAIVPATQTSYNDTEVTRGARYIYAVVALCLGCQSARSPPSNAIPVTVGAAPTTAPTALTVAVVMPQSILVATADSQETQGEDGRATNAIDGKPPTYWHSQWKTALPPLPHRLQLALLSEWWVAGLRYLPRQDAGFNGTIADFRVEVSRDGATWQEVAHGTWPAVGKDWREVRWGPVLAKYVRLWAVSETHGNPAWTSAAEVQLIAGQAPP
jgi:hypothetical protein